MKILLTNDLHGCQRWYDWLLVQAARFDLIAIAGDLFDGFSSDGITPQVLALDRFVAELRKTGCHLAFSTGNHDGNMARDADATLRAWRNNPTADPRVQRLLTSEFWSDAFDFQNEPGVGTVVTDNRATILSCRSGERLLVSTHPYSFDDSAPRSGTLWETASSLRAEKRVAWLALHHEPPAGTQIGGLDGSVGER